MNKTGGTRRRVRRNALLFAENALIDNIVLIQALGLCPVIAAGDSLQKGVALTICTAVVLIPLSFFIALASNWIPKWVRPAAYVVLAALLLVGTGAVMKWYVSPELFAELHLFIPLMAVNMLYNRSMGFSSIVDPIATMVDALGSTVGFGLVICAISALREMMAFGTLWGNPVDVKVLPQEASSPFIAFIMLGFMAALLQWSRQRIKAFLHRKEGDDHE